MIMAQRPSDSQLQHDDLGTKVADLFRSKVANGDWALGTKIPIESELMTMTGAGRNTIREAIASLVQTGILRREQGRGTYVISTSDLRLSVTRRASNASRQQVLELRLALDTAAAQIAATRRTSADAAKLTELLQARENSWHHGTDRDKIATDSALHIAIVDATHNPVLLDVYNGLMSVFEDVLIHDVQTETDRLAEHHTAIVAAITSQDPIEAAKASTSLLRPIIEGLQ